MPALVVLACVNSLCFYLPFSLYRSLNASLPRQTRKNGSLYAHLFVYPTGVSPFNSQYASHSVSPLTVYSPPQDESVNLLSSNEKVPKVSPL